MKKTILLQISVFLLASYFMYSCSSRRSYRTSSSRSSVVAGKSYSESRIMSRGRFSAAQMTRYFLKKNPKASAQSINYIARLYVKEAAYEGVNHDIAFAQMCHETNFLRYGNQVKKWQHNYCGLGATDDGSRGLAFPDAQTGVRVHIQHLKAYGSFSPLRHRLIDPRFKYVKRGTAQTISRLAGTWASDRAYGRHLRAHLSSIPLR